MEKLNDIINKSTVIKDQYGVDQFYDAVNNKHLVPFRGYNSKEHVIKKHVRENRVPRDSNIQFHQTMGDAFEQTFGYNYRSSVFASSTLAEALRYSGISGSVYVVVPIGQVTVCYSTLVTDLAEVQEQFLREVIEILKKDKSLKQSFINYMRNSSHLTRKDVLRLTSRLRGKEKQKAIELGISYIKHFEYKETDDLKKACVESKGNEMMIKCKEYYLVNRKYILEQK